MENSNLNFSNVFILRNFFSNDYGWQNFIDCISDAYDLNDPNNKVEKVKEKLGKINFWQKLTMTLDNINDKNFPGIEEKSLMLSELRSRDGVFRPCTGYFGAVSLTDKEPTTGKHNDPIDVIYCQFVGSVVWNIFYEDGVASFTLNPGDIIYVPKLINHEVVSLSPRAAISFMFGDK